MKELMQRVETIFVKSRLRFPLYLLTVITGVGFFIAPELIEPTIFIAFLGLLLIMESIHPEAYRALFFEPITSFFPTKVQLPLIIMLTICVVMVGLFFLLIVIGVGLARFYN
ncbi:hypothetical protein AB685_27205 [Bacillus sp. LL01]|uniref:hypothetical protein n=1 Tax=Bacillus sp. LL01 TaxID=1665556 RepID=UPI00064CF35F|nr:hypothetical protein [Bacillus sp. LL01]KMJ55447.1 hypothetical protein AB685_27205 [Bacillus sp. LL01]